MSRPRRGRRADDGIEELLRQRGGPAWLPDDEEVPEEELATWLRGGWDVHHARGFLSENRWLAALHEYALQQRVPVHVLEERLGLRGELVEGVDYVKTLAELGPDYA